MYEHAKSSDEDVRTAIGSRRNDCEGAMSKDRRVRELGEITLAVGGAYVDDISTVCLGYAEVCVSLKLPSRRGERVLRYKEYGRLREKMYRSQWRLSRKIGKSLSFPKVFCI